MILLYCSNHSLGFSTFVPPNSISFTWFDFLSTWFIFRFTPIKAFTNAAILGSNPSKFPPDDGLNPPLNPDGNSDSGLLLLFSESGLLLPSPKVLNSPNGFVSIVSKCEKCSLPIFLILIILFY